MTPADYKQFNMNMNTNINTTIQLYYEAIGWLYDEPKVLTHTNEAVENTFTCSVVI